MTTEWATIEGTLASRITAWISTETTVPSCTTPETAKTPEETITTIAATLSVAPEEAATTALTDAAR